MNFLKLFSAALVAIILLSFASCSNGDNEGSMTDQSYVSKSEIDNTVVDKKEDYAFTRDYYNWLYADAFKDFIEAIKVTKLPSDLENSLSSMSEEKKISALRDLFCSKEIVSAVQTVSEYENGKTKYTHDVVSVSKNKKGIYNLEMKFTAGGITTEKKFELMLSDSTRGVSLIRYNEDGYATEYHQIIVSNDGYVAVNRANLTKDGWTSLQLLFRGGDKPEGYCKSESKLKDEPGSIYPNLIYSGFAGK